MSVILPLKDLPMFWQGRANALRILVSQRAPLTSDATLRQAETYEECATELRAALKLRDILAPHGD